MLMLLSGSVPAMIQISDILGIRYSVFVNFIIKYIFTAVILCLVFYKMDPTIPTILGQKTSIVAPQVDIKQLIGVSRITPSSLKN